MPGQLIPVVSISNVTEDQVPDMDSVIFRDYTLTRRLGKGRTSVVFEAQDVVCRETYALKMVLPGRLRVRREARILAHLRGGPNVITLIKTLLDDEGGIQAFVLEAVDHQNFRSLFPKFSMTDIQYYMTKLIQALRFCHAQGVIHRDIRPHNLVINHCTKQLRLVGWGSATFHQPGASHSVRISLFKAPELLLDYDRYDYSLDMWGVGTILASLVFRREPFFCGNSVAGMLRSIAKTLGTDDLYEFVRDYGIELDEVMVESLGDHARCPWRSFLSNENDDENHKIARDQAIDLIDRLLRYNPSQRLSAEQAMDHGFLIQQVGVEEE